MDINLDENSALKEFGYAFRFLKANFDAVEMKPAHSPNERMGGQEGTAHLAGRSYACVIQNSMPRADRLIPLLALALLQARRRKSNSVIPLPMIVVDRGTLALYLHVRSFAAEYLQSDEALAVVAQDGSSCCIGAGLDQLSMAPVPPKFVHTAAPTLSLFSDTHQWLLKVLLSEHFPEKMLTAKRGPYHSGRQLAEAAGVSPVTANRFLQLMREMGFLDATKAAITVIRHKDLLLRWRAASSESKKEVPMRFIFRSDTGAQLRALLEDKSDKKCLGMFGAANLLGLGHVSGVGGHVYVPKLSDVSWGLEAWETATQVTENESPDFYVRQPSASVSVFNGRVEERGIYCTDVIQTWLDISYHPSRGQEQANLIYEKHLRKLCEPHLQ
jgi:hypothetical protein